MFDFNNKEIIDIGSGTGTSTLYLAEYAKRVIGVEPESAMIKEAERKAKELGIKNVSFVEGTAQNIPLPDSSVDVVVGMTFNDYPPETVVPAFVNEATRVVRSGGLIVTTNVAPGWYGGELFDVIQHNLEGAPEERHRQYVDVAGFDWHDVYSITDYGSLENIISAYGFIFGMNAIDYLRKHNKTTIKWGWRRHFKTVYK